MKIALIFEPGHRIGPILQQWLIGAGHNVVIISDEFTDEHKGDDYDFVIPYVMPDDFLTRRNPCFIAANYLEKSGLRMLNSIQSIGYASDKLATFERWRANGIPTPDTTLLGDSFVWPQSKESLIAKPRFGRRGENVKLVTSKTEALKAADATQGDVILQEFIEDARCYRIIASKNEILSQYEKYLPGAVVKNISAGATRRKADLPHSVLELTMKAVVALNGGLMGLDVLVKDGEPYLLEANVPFGFNEHDEDLKMAWLQHVNLAV